MSDRIAVMSRGRVEQIGTPEEIYGAPASVFVAGFIGSANLLPGTLESVSPTGDAGAASTAAPRWSVLGVSQARPGDPVTVMLRPERLNLGRQRRRHRQRHGQGRHLPGLRAAPDHRPGRSAPR